MIPAPGDGWARLDARQLLIDPVKVVKQFFVPLVVVALGISQSEMDWALPFVPLLVLGSLALGAVPWLTTHYRITETQFQLRRGLLNKKSSTAPLDRIRSVDLEASLLHRLLGLEKVQIGTGVDDERIVLDSLGRRDAHALRTTLLRRAQDAAPDDAAPEDVPRDAGSEVADDGDSAPDDHRAAPAAAARPDVREELIAGIDWSWVRFAPFSLGRLVVVFATLGVLSQFGDELSVWDADTARGAWDWVRQFAVLAVAVVVVVGGLAAWVVFSIAGYVVQWWDFRLSRQGDSLALRAGLVTTRSTSIEEARVRGVELTEPVLMRVVSGAEVATLATGVEDGRTQVMPPCPLPVAQQVAGRLLHDDSPLHLPLVPHGPAARRRTWIRHLDVALLAPLVVAGLAWWQDWSWWWVLVAAVAAVVPAGLVAEAAYAHLGHALTPTHLVAGSGSLARVRTVLETDGIIGWVVEQSWFQRRSGLADLVATTAAGSERVLVRDVPLATAVTLADAATPGVLTPFLD